MPWARLGDNAATYPKLMQIAGYRGADDRAVNEVRGWLLACATQSASHLTDYVVDAGTAALFGGARTKVLVKWCVQAGLLTPTKVGGATAWKIISDPEFIHIRTREEVEWDRQRNRDTADMALIVPVRLRDGDNCRYCGVLAQWRGRKSNRSAEYDHRVPGEAATVETLVVACRRCNGARQANPQWGDDHPLRPVPVSPRYGAITAAFLTDNGYPTEPNVTSDATDHADSARATSGAPTGARVKARSGDTATAMAASDPALSATPGARLGAAGAGVGLEVVANMPGISTSGSPESGLPGSGREGTGLGSEGEGRGGDGDRSPRRRRGSRGRGGSSAKEIS